MQDVTYLKNLFTCCRLLKWFELSILFENESKFKQEWIYQIKAALKQQSTSSLRYDTPRRTSLCQFGWFYLIITGILNGWSGNPSVTNNHPSKYHIVGLFTKNSIIESTTISYGSFNFFWRMKCPTYITFNGWKTLN